MTSLGRRIMTLFLLAYFAATLFAQTTELRPSINKIANKLRKENEVHFGYPVGFAGAPETNNKYYKQYLKLKDKATDDELVQLTNDTSECVVVYSFDILWQRQHSNLKNVFLQHQNDTTFFGQQQDVQVCLTESIGLCCDDLTLTITMIAKDI